MLLAQTDPVVWATILAAMIGVGGALLGVAISEMIRYVGRIRRQGQEEASATATTAATIAGIKEDLESLKMTVEKIESDNESRERRVFDRLESILRPFTDPDVVSKRASDAAENRRDILDNTKAISNMQGRFEALKSQVDSLQGAKEERAARVQGVADRVHLMESEYGERFGKIDSRLDGLNRALPVPANTVLKDKQ